MNIKSNIQLLEKDIEYTLKESQRDKNSLRMIAVTKNHSIEEIKEAIHAGIYEFGENYLQEALPKIEALKTLPLTWHFIGPIQKNKIKRIATHFSWIHSVCTDNVAEQLNTHRPEHLPPLQVCIQVNIDAEPTKSGVLPEALLPLAQTILTLPRLKLRGIMILPKHKSADTTTYDNPFPRAASLLKTLNHTLNVNLDTLSMGMSDDFHEAIRAGSTCVRIGSKIFGPR